MWFAALLIKALIEAAVSSVTAGNEKAVEAGTSMQDIVQESAAAAASLQEQADTLARLVDTFELGSQASRQAARQTDAGLDPRDAGQAARKSIAGAGLAADTAGRNADRFAGRNGAPHGAAASHGHNPAGVHGTPGAHQATGANGSARTLGAVRHGTALRTRGAVHANGTAQVNGLAYRHGLAGTEFLILLPGIDPTVLADVAQRIANSIADADILADDRITVSAGVALWAAGTPAGALEAADQALYRAKADGRNRVAGAEVAEVAGAGDTDPGAPD